MPERISMEQINEIGEKTRQLELYRRSVEGMRRNLNSRAPNYVKELKRLDGLITKKQIELFGK
jgi:hypothetical protein